MNRDDIQKLLGGYATGTLTPEEQQALFEAALSDQELFDALAREQSLRDLLRDPAAKAHVLAALDGPRPRWWGARWLERPVALALAMAGMAAIGIFVLSQKVKAPQTQLVAELRTPAPSVPAAPPAAEQPPPPTDLKKADSRVKPAPVAAEREALTRQTKKDEAASPPMVAAEKAAALAEEGKQIMAAGRRADASPAVPTAPLAPLPGRQAGGGGGQFGAIGGIPAGRTRDAKDSLKDTNATLDAVNARALFYGTQSAQMQSRDKESQGANSGPPPQAQQQQQASQGVQSTASNRLAAAKTQLAATVPHLGVRCTLLRKQPNGEDAEADLNQILNAGETVRIRLVPNDNGVLYVWESAPGGGWRTLAHSGVQRLKPFDTPPLKRDQAGAKEFRVLFSRVEPGMVAPEALAGPARNNLVRTEADLAERATFLVSGSAPGSQQLVFAISLTYK